MGKVVDPKLPPLVREKLDAIADLARRNHVRRLYLFGSAVRDDFNETRSDLDFAVEFQPDMERRGFEDPYFDLMLGLQALFDRKVDLVEQKAVRNTVFRENLHATRVLVYEA